MFYLGKMYGAGPSRSIPKAKTNTPLNIILIKSFFVSGRQFIANEIAI